MTRENTLRCALTAAAFMASTVAFSATSNHQLIFLCPAGDGVGGAGGNAKKKRIKTKEEIFMSLQHPSQDVLPFGERVRSTRSTLGCVCPVTARPSDKG